MFSRFPHVSILVPALVTWVACNLSTRELGDASPEPTFDASLSSSQDAAVADSGPEQPAPDAGVWIACGDEDCDGEEEECCFLNAGPGPMCVDLGTCQGATLECDGPEDCADGQSCCRGDSSKDVECTPADSCGVELCHSAADCGDPEDECCDLDQFDMCAPTCPD